MSESNDAPHPTSQGTILVLEDEAIPRLHLEQALRKNLACTVLSTADGASALGVAVDNRVDVMVFDILMPGRDGIETAAEILATQDASLIFLSASTDERTLARASALNPRAMLEKPMDVNRLVAEVRGALADREQAREDLLAPHFLLDTIYDTARIGMCVTDAERRFVRVNRAYCDTYGWSREELIGQPFTLVLPEAARDHAAAIHDDFIYERIPEIPAEWTVQTRRGDLRTVFVTAGRMIGLDGQPYKVTTVTDITEQKRRDARLRDALAAKDTLLREVHHRVKNNLNTLSSLLALQLETAQHKREVVNAITVSINRIKTMSTIYQRLHTSEHIDRIDLEDYLTGLLRDLLETANRTAEVTLDLAIESIGIDIDLGIAVGLIVNELATNSLSHGIGRGRRGVITLTLLRRGEMLHLDVSDNGVGLPAGFSIGESNTLGLQLVQSLVGQHRGRVTIVDTGTARFSVQLPINDTE